MANTYLHRTMGSGDRNKWTLSVWVKKSTNGANQRIITVSDNSSYDDNLRFDGNDNLVFIYNNATVIITNRKFRDTNAWYHIVLKVDTAQATADDRVLLYINGVHERTNGYSTDNIPAQSQDGYINHNVQHVIGMTNPTANSNHFNGCMSHYHFTDGYAYDASTFGETDATTGEWKINTSPSITMGTNGFTILKDGNTITDQSSNSNDFTLGAGTLTQTEDCPSNVFATFNPLIYSSNNSTFSNGNTRVVGGSANWRQQGCTMGIAENQGKYYWEMKGVSGSDFNGLVGIKDVHFANSGNYNYPTGYGSDGGHGIAYGKGGELYTNTVPATSSWGATYSAGDIISVAFDADNMKLYFAKNGTWQNSGDPTSGSTGTGAVSVVTTGSGENIWLPFVTTHAGGWDCNFGNGYFGTSAISSEGTNASGIGKFEYDVPSGYTALSTKGLNE